MFIDIPSLRYMKEPEKSIATEYFFRELIKKHNREIEELNKKIEELRKNGSKET